MAPRKRVSAGVRAESAPRMLRDGDAVRLADGGDAVLVGADDRGLLVRVGTGHRTPLCVPLASLTLVQPADETDKHRKFRLDAVRRGELEAM